MNDCNRGFSVFGAVAILAVGGCLTLRVINGRSARRRIECRALTTALDKTIRARSPRYFEGIVENRYDVRQGRCLAALEYHYKPCNAKQSKKIPQICSGPDADIGIYFFHDAGARPLFLCERTYATGEARCTETVYGVDGSELSSREFPPEQFPAIKAEWFGPRS